MNEVKFITIPLTCDFRGHPSLNHIRFRRFRVPRESSCCVLREYGEPPQMLIREI